MKRRSFVGVIGLLFGSTSTRRQGPSEERAENQVPLGGMDLHWEAMNTKPPKPESVYDVF